MPRAAGGTGWQSRGPRGWLHTPLFAVGPNVPGERLSAIVRGRVDPATAPGISGCFLTALAWARVSPSLRPHQQHHGERR